MPFPLVLIGISIAAGALGARKGIQGQRKKRAARTNYEEAEEIYEEAEKSLKKERTSTKAALTRLGKAKIVAYTETMPRSIDAFSKLKKVDFDDQSIVKDIEMIKLGENSLADIRAIGTDLKSYLAGNAGALGAGAMTGLAAYGTAAATASASTGTAISSLSGVAASNATLAWFGGGSLASGGMGVAGGVGVLGGIVAGPVLLVGGCVMNSAAEKNLADSRSTLTKAAASAKQMRAAELSARAIRKRANNLRKALLAYTSRLDELLDGLEKLVSTGTDYRKYSKEDRQGVAITATLASAVAILLRVNLITAKGNVTRKSAKALKSAEEMVNAMAHY